MTFVSSPQSAENFTVTSNQHVKKTEKCTEYLCTFSGDVGFKDLMSMFKLFYLSIKKKIKITKNEVLNVYMKKKKQKKKTQQDI